MIDRIKWRTFWLIFLSWFTCLFVFSPLALAVLPDIYEKDDPYLLADVIGLNYDTQRHNFHDAAQDWVKFYGVANEIYEIKVSNVGANCDPVIELYDLDGETLLQGPRDCPGATSFRQMCK